MGERGGWGGGGFMDRKRSERPARQNFYIFCHQQSRPQTVHIPTHYSHTLISTHHDKKHTGIHNTVQCHPLLTDKIAHNTITESKTLLRTYIQFNYVITEHETLFGFEVHIRPKST